MKHKFLLFLLAAAMTFPVAAQQTRLSFVAKSDNQQQVFLLEDYPRLTVTTLNGEPVFTVKDQRNRTMNGVRTCLFNKNHLETDITLLDNENADYYTQFANDYNGLTLNTATLNRQFTSGKWATLCLPFNVNKSLMTALGLYNRVFSFRYAELLDDQTVQAYFVPAQSIEAGKGYIVNANAKLADKTSFVFPNVTIDTDVDVGDITDLRGYNDDSGRGNLYLVGTLRTGLLYGSTDGNTYLGLKDNHLFYPNTANGTSIRAYRGIFRSEEPMAVQQVRIVVDGENRGEWLLDDGQMNGNDGVARKFIDNGVLYIEREGIIYDTQGKRID